MDDPEFWWLTRHHWLMKHIETFGTAESSRWRHFYNGWDNLGLQRPTPPPAAAPDPGSSTGEDTGEK